MLFSDRVSFFGVLCVFVVLFACLVLAFWFMRSPFGLAVLFCYCCWASSASCLVSVRVSRFVRDLCGLVEGLCLCCVVLLRCLLLVAFGVSCRLIVSCRCFCGSCLSAVVVRLVCAICLGSMLLGVRPLLCLLLGETSVGRGRLAPICAGRFFCSVWSV